MQNQRIVLILSSFCILNVLDVFQDGGNILGRMEECYILLILYNVGRELLLGFEQGSVFYKQGILGDKSGCKFHQRGI